MNIYFYCPEFHVFYKYFNNSVFFYWNLDTNKLNKSGSSAETVSFYVTLEEKKTVMGYKYNWMSHA